MRDRRRGQRREELSLKDLVLETVKTAEEAIDFNDLLGELEFQTYVTRQRLRRVLAEQIEEGNIKNEVYKIEDPDASFMKVIVADVYYADEDQREEFEENTLPQLEEERREAML